MKKYSYVLGVVKIRYSSFSVSSCSDVSAMDWLAGFQQTTFKHIPSRLISRMMFSPKVL